MNKSEEQKARMKSIAEKIERHKLEAAEKDIEFYNTIISGKGWKIFTAFVIFCMLLNVIITIDTYVDGKTHKITASEFRFDRSLGALNYQSIWIDNDLFLVEFQELAGFDKNSFTVTESLILGDPKYITFQRQEISYNEVKPIETKQAMRRVSIYESFPLGQIVLLLPMLVLLFKRPKPWFNFARYMCMILIFPSAIALLLFLAF